ncbi:sugar transporter SWEET1-like isoform X1 [Diadema setosum]|uniref:sugar transporter SWEET1-like isoform X1 n=1 Tax=Diadema setosum TaxID=31175 RepID=UPI003B3B8DE9
MDSLAILSWICIVTTIGFFLSGIPVFIPIIKSGTTGNTPFLPFLLGFLNAIACLWYGILKDDFTMIVVNVVGSVLHVFYVLAYLLCAKDKAGARQQAVYGITFLLGLYVYFNHVIKDEALVENQLGLTTCIMVLATNVSPLAELGSAIRERSSESFSAFMAVAMCVTSLAWTLYGALIEDIYVQIPSVPGMVSGITQLALLWTFPSSGTGKRAKSD